MAQNENLQKIQDEVQDFQKLHSLPNFIKISPLKSLWNHSWQNWNSSTETLEIRIMQDMYTPISFSNLKHFLHSNGAIFKSELSKQFPHWYPFKMKSEQNQKIFHWNGTNFELISDVHKTYFPHWYGIKTEIFVF